MKILQGLLMDGNFKMQAVIDGTKTASVREGKRPYYIGKVLIGDPNGKLPCVLKSVTVLRQCRLEQLAISEVKRAGYHTHQALFGELLRYYKDIEAFSPITYIEWA